MTVRINLKVTAFMLSFILIICLIPINVFALESNSINDPLELIQVQDNCDVEKTAKGVYKVKLSDNSIAIYEKMQSKYGGKKYKVTEGELVATIEITANDNIYINDKKVKYDEESAKISKVASQNSIEPQSGWAKWTMQPLEGNASSYTRIIATHKNKNIQLESALRNLPTAVALAAITGPLGIGVAIGLTFATECKGIYESQNLNPKTLFYNESIRKHKKTDKATQYVTVWIDTYGNPIKPGKKQYAYFTIG